MQQPQRLAPGMTVGVVAPSSPGDARSKVLRGVEKLEQLGFGWQRCATAPPSRS